MFAISLWQPWASLWAAGIKVHETRDWRCDDKLGQVIAIHAAKRVIGRRDLDPRVAQIMRVRFGDFWEKEIPRGALLGSGRLVACWRTENRRPQIEPDELSLGNWSAGRYAWQLADVVPLPTPIPCTGRQAWFDVPNLFTR